MNAQESSLVGATRASPSASGDAREAHTNRQLHTDRGEFSGTSKRRKGPYCAERCDQPPPRELLEGIHQFNHGEFFEQHETLELLWRATEDDVRYLYQGILLVGVGFYHLERGNLHGAQSKLAAGIEMLEWFSPRCQTVDVADLIARTRPCLQRIYDLGMERLSQFERSSIPQVRLFDT